ncbi:MAG: hypothetical protein VB013_07995 [Anaerolineaceae bacterium]|nr:hypothetical protein [Anaerolineaceae bacterium]
MPNLHQTLRETDLDFLERIARQWRLDLLAKGFQEALEELENKLCDESLFNEVIEALPADVKASWQYLVDRKGKETWSQFTRQFGEVRAMGLAKRERVSPDETPISVCEALWYKALIGRAFLRSSGEPQEYAYIPEEFLQWAKPTPQIQPLQPRPATEAETKFPLKANDRILDDATDLLAALRMGRIDHEDRTAYQLSYFNFTRVLLASSEVLTSEEQPDPARLKEFLSASRGQVLNMLFTDWQQSTRINDLRMLPGLIFEGNWTNDPLLPRQLMLSLLHEIKPNTWWSISSLLTQIKANQPDFQRSAGDYDAWFIRDAKTNAHLQGSKNWDKVEGALLRYLIAGPLHWLGLLDLGCTEKNSRPSAFRLSRLGSALLAGETPNIEQSEEGSITVPTNNTLVVPQNAPRTMRYQVARFGQKVKQTPTETTYLLTPASLRAAASQGLLGSHLILLLQQARVKNIPPALSQQLERWDKYGSEAEIRRPVLLRLARPEILPLLQKNTRSARCIEEVLTPKAVLLKPGTDQTIVQVLSEMGFLTEVNLNEDV